MFHKKQLISIIILLVITILGLFVFTIYLNQSMPTKDSVNKQEGDTYSQDFKRYGLDTNTAIALIELDKVISGGPGKDGIPSINNPKFVQLPDVDETNPNLTDETRGIFIEHNNIRRFYPYNILVWHEIVNDTLDDLDVAVTFCPLCGSAIAYERKINKTETTFGVSGLLYESNLLMYDKETESLWSQIEGRAVVGDLAGTELKLVPIQLLTFKEIKDNYDSFMVLSENTGYTRDYKVYPYGDYDQNDDLYFDVTYKDQRLQIKELMYAVNVDDQSISFVVSKLQEQKEASIRSASGKTIVATFDNGEIKVEANNVEIPGFYTQWFSWANHNLPEGVNKDSNGIVWGLD